MEQHLINMTKVYIIESPSYMDILDNRKEGEALSKILDLGQIKNEVHSVSNQETLLTALDRIADDVNATKKDLGGIYLHFSLHGNKNGIALSDNTFLNWESFFNFIKHFNDRVSYLETNGIKISPTYLVFSVCDGYYAKAIKDFDKEKFSTYSIMVGPVSPVEWSDSLLAYSIFYHNVIIKQIGTPAALKNMNTTIGLENVFRADSGTGLDLF